MLTAILITTAIVIAVMMYSLIKVSGKCSRVEEEESYKWAKKWNEQREKELKTIHDYCDGFCGDCDELEYCPFREV